MRSITTRVPATALRMRVMMAAAVVALTLASCGSRGLSKPDYISQADAICTGVRYQLDGLTPPSSIAEIGSYLKSSIRLNEDLRRKLGGLAPPSGDSDRTAKILSDFDDVLTKGRAAQRKAEEGDESGTDVAVKELATAVDRAGGDARDYGFKSCGSAGPSPNPSPAASGTPSAASTAAPAAGASTGPVPGPPSPTGAAR